MEQVLNLGTRKDFCIENQKLLGFIFLNFIKIYNLHSFL